MAFDVDKMHVTHEGFGLLLGAGASCQAGYPLMDGLTRQVLRSLDAADVEVIASIVKADLGTELDIGRATPSIEVITDVLEARMASLSIASTDSQVLQAVSERIRTSIVGIMCQQHPRLDDHVRLFQALKRCLGGKPCSIWVFTTNYDLLVEWGAAIAGLPVYDGFYGSSLRFFDIGSIGLKHGAYRPDGRGGNVFVAVRTPQVNLLKLHGSVNWWICGNDEAYSSDRSPTFCSNPRRALVLPRKSKVRDILEYPFEGLWRLASEVLGRECKYVTSVGFSYGDQHIRERLLLPKVRRNEIALTALLKDETEAIDMFRGLPSFQCSAGTESSLWRFKDFVNYVCSTVGWPEEGSDVALRNRQSH